MHLSIPLITEVLHRNQSAFGAVVPIDLNAATVLVLDLTIHNQELNRTNLLNTASFEEYIWSEMKKTGAIVAVGGYNEDRVIYRRSENFSGAENRSIHLGIDIWTKAGTPVLCPIPGEVHSFQDNVGFGNYGPTIILRHTLEGVIFYTLYGHLSSDSLRNLRTGQTVDKGDRMGIIGNYPENGDWPPHLHFQVITTMQNWSGDFPGVAALSERAYYLQLCPDPNLILQIKSLQKVH